MLISLKRRAVASLDLSAHERIRLTTSSGVAWVTMEGLPEDFALTPSSPLKFTGPGRIVIENLEDDMVIRAELTQERAHEPLLLATR